MVTALALITWHDIFRAVPLSVSVMNYCPARSIPLTTDSIICDEDHSKLINVSEILNEA